MDKELTTERIELIRERIFSELIIDGHHFVSKNLDISAELDRMMMGTRYSFTQWFLARKLKEDYTWRHPKNFWHLFLFFTFGVWWSWFNQKFIQWAEHTITIKEAYGNIAMPDKKPVVYIQRLRNGCDNLEFNYKKDVGF